MTFKRALLLLLMPLLGLLLFTSAGRDDAHITYWAAYSLAHFGKILNYSGLPVEQSSTLLQTLFLAGMHALSGMDMVVLGKTTSILFGVGSIFLLTRITGRAGAALFLSIAPTFVYWSFSGMEATLAALILLGAVAATGNWLETRSRANLLWAWIWIAPLLLVRPEMPLVWLAGLGLACGWLAVQQLLRKDLNFSWLWQAILPIGLFSLAVFLILMLGRLSVFGMPFPQPVSVKTGRWNFQEIRDGLQYLSDNARPETLILLALAVAGIFKLTLLPRAGTQHRPVDILAASVIAMQLTFITLTGGDWMEGGRFIVPILPLLAMFAVRGLDQLVAGGKMKKISWTAIVAINLIGLVAFAAAQSTGIPLWNALEIHPEFHPQNYSWFERRSRINLRDIPVVEKLDSLVAAVREEKGGRVILLSGQMGMVPYRVAEKYFGQISVLDRRGLASRELVTCPAADKLGRTSTGVQLYYAYFFKHLDAFQACGVPLPDIIYDLGDASQSNIPEEEYALVYAQSGELNSGSLLPGLPLAANEFIYVRRQYQAAIAKTGSTTILFNDIADAR